jgi:hypothetical protein
VLGQHALAMRVDLLGEVGDAGLLVGGCGGEGEGVEASRLQVEWVIAYTPR